MTTATDRTQSTKEGVQDAWDFWLSQHPISVPEIIEAAVRDAVTAWMDDHADAILAIFQRAAQAVVVPDSAEEQP